MFSISPISLCVCALEQTKCKYGNRTAGIFYFYLFHTLIHIFYLFIYLFLSWAIKKNKKLSILQINLKYCRNLCQIFARPFRSRQYPGWRLYSMIVLWPNPTSQRYRILSIERWETSSIAYAIRWSVTVWMKLYQMYFAGYFLAAANGINSFIHAVLG